MTLTKEQDKSSIPLPTLLVFTGLFVAFIGYETCNEIVDEGKLTSKEITIQKGPVYIKGSKKTPNRYRFYTNEYLSPFWIAGKGFSNIEDNENLRLALQQIKKNDTLKVIFLTSRQNTLDNIEPVVLYGLADQKVEYFSPGMIRSATGNRTKLLFLAGVALLIAGLVLRLKKFKSKFNQPVGETT